MNPVSLIAAKEFQRAVRNRWVVATTLLMLVLSLSLSLLGSAPTGTVAANKLGITVVSLSSLSTFLVPLIALMLSYDAIVGEIEGGTLLLLLTYPVKRWQIVAGKFLGHTAVLTVATLLGYGTAGIAIGVIEETADISAWVAFAVMCGSTLLLGMAFLTMGYVASSVVRERGTAAGLAVSVWLVFVLLFDMAILGALVADKGAHLTANAVNILLMLNPADVYRMLNLTGSDDVAALAGMVGISGTKAFTWPVLTGVMVLWSMLPFGLAVIMFQRREL